MQCFRNSAGIMHLCIDFKFIKELTIESLRIVACSKLIVVNINHILLSAVGDLLQQEENQNLKIPILGPKCVNHCVHSSVQKQGPKTF